VSRTFFSMCLALSLLACGGGEPPPTRDTAGGDTAGGDTAAASCEGYAPTDGCMNEDNFAQCQQMAAHCPGQVQVMESCPLQFGCP